MLVLFCAFYPWSSHNVYSRDNENELHEKEGVFKLFKVTMSFNAANIVFEIK